MIEEKKSSIQYLTGRDVEIIHSEVSRLAITGGEPIPSLSHADRAGIDAFVRAPQKAFFGIEAYPSDTNGRV